MMKLSLLLTAAALAFPALAEPGAAANPLLSASPLAFNYPQFDKIRDSDFGPAFDAGMAQQAREVAAIADSAAAPTFDNTIVEVEATNEACRGRSPRTTG